MVMANIIILNIMLVATVGRSTRHTPQSKATRLDIVHPLPVFDRTTSSL